jgi:hypothetical protein
MEASFCVINKEILHNNFEKLKAGNKKYSMGIDKFYKTKKFLDLDPFKFQELGRVWI